MCVLTSFAASAQHGLSMYHLGNATYQNTQFNAAHMPDYGRVFLGLPVLSGINLHVNSKLSYNEIFSKGSDSTLLDISKAISNLSARNGVHAHVNLNLFHLGIRLPNNGVVSVFANERVEADLLFPTRLARFLWEGNTAFLEREVNIGRTALNVMHYREIGLGYAYALPQYRMKVGIRAKYLQGLFNAGTPGAMEATFLTQNENNQWNIDVSNGRIRTAGVEIATGDQGDIGTHLISNGNQGAALDLGLEYEYNRYYTVSIGVNDLGFINWKENTKQYSIPDTSVVYTGAQLYGAHESFQDSIETFVNRFAVYDNSNENYGTMLPARIFGSVVYKGFGSFDVISTISSRVIHGDPRFSFSVGGRYSLGPWLTVSANVVKLDQQFFNAGLALASKVGPVQLYMASDNVLGYNAPDISAVDFRFGINFIFDKKAKKQDNSLAGASQRGPLKQKKDKTKGPKGTTYGFFLGEEVKIKGKDAIYSVIKKQKRRKLKNQRSPKPIFRKGKKGADGPGDD